MHLKPLAILALLLPLPSLAAPTPVGPFLAIDGDGLNSTWVDLTYSPHSVSDALAALALPANDPQINQRYDQVVPYIDWADGQGGTDGLDTTTTFTDLPVGSDDNFAVRFQGFLNITTAGEYDFQVYTDDGFQLSLGGEVVAEFLGDRGPAASAFSVTLAAGLYALDLVGWEQGGQYVDELTWDPDGDTLFTTVPQSVLFTSAVPEPETWPMLLAGLGLVGWGARRSQSRD